MLKARHKGKCKPFDTDLKHGEICNHSLKPLFKVLPVKVEYFIGRASECQKVVEFLNSHRLVSINGISGIGKSAIAKEVSHYLFNRGFAKDGVIYMSLADCHSIENFFKRFSIPIKNVFAENNNPVIESRKNDDEKVFAECLKHIKDRNILIVLDNCDTLMRLDHMAFVIVIEDILGRSHNSKILMTSCIPIGHIKDVNEKIVEIKELKPIDSLELLKTRSTTGLSDEELLEMMDTVEMKSINSQNKSILDHPFFRIINGHPLALVMVASLKKEMRLKQIYELLMLIKEENDNEEKIDSQNIAINLSMEANLLFLRGVDNNSYNSLIFFALLPSGVSNEDCSKLFGNQWEEYKILLLSKSLIFKRFNTSENKEMVVYRIDTNLKKMLLKRATKQEVSD